MFTTRRGAYEFEPVGSSTWDHYAMPHERRNQVYEMYIRVMRRLGHYRWFSLSMKHVLRAA
jgi:hypothetical protein